MSLIIVIHCLAMHFSHIRCIWGFSHAFFCICGIGHDNHAEFRWLAFLHSTFLSCQKISLHFFFANIQESLSILVSYYLIFSLAYQLQSCRSCLHYLVAMHTVVTEDLKSLILTGIYLARPAMLQDEGNRNSNNKWPSNPAVLGTVVRKSYSSLLPLDNLIGPLRLSFL
jgi:hypothetical protein